MGSEMSGILGPLPPYHLGFAENEAINQARNNRGVFFLGGLGEYSRVFVRCQIGRPVLDLCFGCFRC